MNLDDVINQLWTESDNEDEIIDNIDEDDALEDVLLSATVVLFMKLIYNNLCVTRIFQVTQKTAGRMLTLHLLLWNLIAM